MQSTHVILAGAFSTAADKNNYDSFPKLAFPTLFVFLILVGAFVYWLFGKRR